MALALRCDQCKRVDDPSCSGLKWRQVHVHSLGPQGDKEFCGDACELSFRLKASGEFREAVLLIAEGSRDHETTRGLLEEARQAVRAWFTPRARKPFPWEAK